MSEMPEPAAPVSRHLVAVSSAVRRRISDGLHARGHALSASVTHLVPNLPEEGLGISALAQRIQHSIQRTGQLVQQLEEDGYVERTPDPHDGRAKRVVYTARGIDLLRDIAALQDEITNELEGLLGEKRFSNLRRDLTALDVALNGTASGIRIASGH